LEVRLHLIARESLVLYPFWFIELDLGPNQGGITSIQVGIWADNGKIEYAHPTGVHGIIPDTTTQPLTSTSPQGSPQTSQTPQPENTSLSTPSPLTAQTPTENSPTQPFTLWIAAVASIIVALSVIIAAVYWKKKQT
jgi:hypothetical protein